MGPQRAGAVVSGRSSRVSDEVLAEAMDAYYREGLYGREANEESMRAALEAVLGARPVPVITEAAVEQVAAVFYTGTHSIAWSQIDPNCSVALNYREFARDALDAALPLLATRSRS